MGCFTCLACLCCAAKPKRRSARVRPAVVRIVGHERAAHAAATPQQSRHPSSVHEPQVQSHPPQWPSSRQPQQLSPYHHHHHQQQQQQRGHPQQLPPIKPKGRLDPKNVEAAMCERAAMRDQERRNTLSGGRALCELRQPTQTRVERPGEAAAAAAAAAAARAARQQLAPINQGRSGGGGGGGGGGGRSLPSSHPAPLSTRCAPLPQLGSTPTGIRATASYNAAFSSAVEARLNDWSTSSETPCASRPRTAAGRRLVRSACHTACAHWPARLLRGLTTSRFACAWDSVRAQCQSRGDRTDCA